MANQRDLWLPVFETRVIELIGHDWPDILVERWETNGIGERRFVSSKMYSSFDPQRAEATNTDGPPGWRMAAVAR